MPTAHEIVEMARREVQEPGLLSIAAVVCAATFSGLRVSDEVEKQYGRCFAWETSGIWLRRFFFVYFFPMLALQFVVVWAVTTDAHEKLINWVFNGSPGFAAPWDFPILAVALVVGAYLLVTYWVRVRKLEPEPLPSETIDMSKWTQDEGGQWFRITYRHGEDALYDPKRGHKERAAGWVKTKRYAKVWGWNAFLSAVCFLIFYALMVYGNLSGLPFVAVGIVVVASGAWGFVALLNWVIAGSALARGRGDFVGPTAAAGAGGRGVEQVEKQKVYGEGGFATREEIHQAAHGKTVGHAGETVGHADEIEFDD